MRRARRILDGAWLAVRRGTIATLEGPSGSGKSTLLRVFAGLVAPDAGEVRFAGRSVLAIPPEEHRRRVSYVAQTPVMLERSIGDEVRVGPRLRRVEIDDARVRDLLARVAFDPASLDLPSRDLSGGERVRVALARALANEPEALLLDEPTAPLDPDAASRVLALVRGLARDGLGVVVVTHSVEHAEVLGGARHRCVAGRVTRIGPKP